MAAAQPCAFVSWARWGVFPFFSLGDGRAGLLGVGGDGHQPSREPSQRVANRDTYGHGPLTADSHQIVGLQSMTNP